MFHFMISGIPETVVDLYRDIRASNWRSLSNAEYASLISYHSSLISSTLNTQLAYYALYLSVAIEHTQSQPNALGLWKGLEQNLLAACKELAQTIQAMNTATLVDPNSYTSPMSAAAA